MNNPSIKIFFSILLFACFTISLQPGGAFAQTQEPEVIPLPDPKSPYGEGKRNSLGFNIVLNNFGFGLAGQYSRLIAPYTDITISAGFTGIRDVSEQNFRDFFTGQRIIPNKFNRALGFPLMVGVKHRLFASKIDDNFRFFVAAGGGPAMAFVFPYLNDIDGNGFRSPVTIGNVQILEPINDFFSGWGDGELEFGTAGEFKIGADIGENFSRLTTIEFGFFFYYFPQGLQIMEPRRPVIENNQVVLNPDGTFKSEPFFDKQSFFGSPKISLIFGGIW